MSSKEALCAGGFEELLKCFSRDISRYYDLFMLPKSVDAFLEKVAVTLSECLYSLEDYDFVNDESLGSNIPRLTELIAEALRKYYGLKEGLEPVSMLRLIYSKSKGLGLLKEFIKASMDSLRHESLFVDFKTTDVFREVSRSGRLRAVKVRIYGYESSNETFSNYLGVSEEVVEEAFGLSGNCPLYAHQLKALENLSRLDGSLVITPNASGKTEIGILYALNLLRREFDKPILILIVYPTKALTRDQLGRWRKALTSVLGNRLRCYVVELDKDTVVRDHDKLANISRSDKPLVVLTNPAFLLSIARNEGSWRRYLGSRCIALLIIDEVHFYSSRDLTLLTLLMKYLIERHSCLNNCKVLMLSATIGEPENLVEKFERELGVRLGIVRASLSEGVLKGVKNVYIVRCRDDREVERLIVKYLLELVGKAGSPEMIEKTLVFVPTRNIAERILNEVRSKARRLGFYDYGFIDIHLGDMASYERMRVERNFKEGRTRVLLTVKTLEVGIDIGDVQRVIHWHIPHSLNDFIQREGRAGRRGGAYESVIFITSERELDLLNKYLRVIGDTEGIVRLMSRPYIRMNSELMRRIKRLISASRGRIPRYVDVFGFRWPVNFYTQDSRRYRVIASRKSWHAAREVHVADVIYRYLPGMIRFINGRHYIVRSVDERRRSVYLKELSSTDSLLSVWRNASVNDVRCFDIGLIRKGLVFTVTDVDVSFNIATESLSKSMFIQIVERPLGVKLIRKQWKKVRVPDPNTGAEIELSVPVFTVCGELQVSDELSDSLATRKLTRGVYVKLGVDEVPGLIESVKLRVGEVPRDERLWVSKHILNDYAHLALHLIISMAHDRWRFKWDDLEHYVNVSIPTEERSLVSSIIERITGVPAGLDRACLECVVANEVDIVDMIDWIELLAELSVLEERVCGGVLKGEELHGVMRDLIPSLYAWWCQVTPESVGIVEGDEIVYPDALKLIVRLARRIVEKIVAGAG